MSAVSGKGVNQKNMINQGNGKNSHMEAKLKDKSCFL